MPYLLHEDHLEAQRRWRQGRRQRVREIKLETGCKNGCQVSDPALLHFHHRDPATKLFKVGNGAQHPWVQIEAEIAKCDVLCEDCHRQYHNS